MRAPARRRRACARSARVRRATYCEARGLCRRDHWTPSDASRRRRDDAPALRVDGRRVGARRFYAAACDPARTASSRPAPARARPGCWSRACCARCSTARRRTRSWRSPSRAPPPARCGAARRLARRFSTPRSTHEQRVAALVVRGVAPARARGARARARRPCTAACSRPAGRSRSAPSMPGSRSCCASAPLALLDRLGVRADGADRGPGAITGRR